MSFQSVVQTSRWASLPPEILRDVVKRLEANESTTWPARKHIVACASVCKSWRVMCKAIVKVPEFFGKFSLPASVKQLGPRDGIIQCFIKRDKSNSTYHLFLCLNPGKHTCVESENGQFLLSAKRHRSFKSNEYVISIDADNISRSSNPYIGKLSFLDFFRSNFLGTKFTVHDTQPPYNGASQSPPARTGHLCYSQKVSPEVPVGNYNIDQVAYEPYLLGKRGPRRMHCTMRSIPVSSLEPGYIVGTPNDEGKDGDGPLIFRNRTPKWHNKLKCWCLNFQGRVTVASVKNFQLLIAGSSSQLAAGVPTPTEPAPAPNEQKVILQFGRVGKDMFTMDYRYPLSAFQAFAICLTTFGSKFACE